MLAIKGKEQQHAATDAPKPDPMSRDRMEELMLQFPDEPHGD